jgi:hypothetical protein
MIADLVGSPVLKPAPGARSTPRGIRAGRVVVALTAIVIVSGGCSAGDLDANGDDTPADAIKKAAATTTTEKNPACVAVAPFYWEIGDARGALISGSVARARGATAPVASTVMSLSSASKWLFGAYAVEKMNGMPAATYVPFLNFTSGYAGLAGNSCPASATVDDCLAGAAGTQIAEDIGKFAYDGAHLQKLASLMGLGAADNTALAAEVSSQIGPEIGIAYRQPQPASGVAMSADQYTIFLRKLLVGSPTPLLIGSMLGSDAVCTNPMTCSTAVSSPIPGSANPTESWHYGLAHWIEDDPIVGDGAFSSPGRLGFYPWVDATRTIYGVLAREAPDGPFGYDSAVCGRSIRKAWVTGVAQ